MSTEEIRPFFPYQEIWEDFSDDWVTMDQLRLKLMIFRTRFRLLSAAGSPTPMVETASILALMEGLNLAPWQKEKLAEQLYLVAGFYLEPEQLAQWQTDVRSSARTLKNIQDLAGKLSTSLQEISAQVSHALAELHNIGLQSAEPKSKLDVPLLVRKIEDLERVAERMVSDISNRKPGRKTNKVRQNALQLVLEITEGGGIGRVTVSPGNIQNHEPHFTGALGEFVRDFFKLIAPNLSERTLVQNVGQLRRSRH